jgi:hypothetical protein
MNEFIRMQPSCISSTLSPDIQQQLATANTSLICQATFFFYNNPEILSVATVTPGTNTHLFNNKID